MEDTLYWTTIRSTGPMDGWRWLWVLVRIYLPGFAPFRSWTLSGSLFNHSQTPNVTYTLDLSTDSIRYSTVKEIESGSELLIFYGHNLWFDPVGAGAEAISASPTENEDPLPGIGLDEDSPLPDSDPDEIVPEEQLPFTRFKPPPEEEDMASIHKGMYSFLFEANRYSMFSQSRRGSSMFQNRDSLLLSSSQLLYL